MKLTFKIAWRYIFSKKSTNAINVISGISITGITIGSAALIIVLSAFNGFEDLVVKLYASFYPDISITATEGKTFILPLEQREAIKNVDGVVYLSDVLEENALLAYKDQEHIATLKGVDNNYKEVTAVDDSTFIGEYGFEADFGSVIVNTAVFGSGIAQALSLNVGLDYEPVQVFMPKRGIKSTLNPADAFYQKSLSSVGIFRIQQDFDSKYVITSIDFMQQLLNYKNGELSEIEIKLKDGVESEFIVKEIESILGTKYTVKNRVMQNAFLYKVMRNEKWMVYLILTFILIIAAFNMIGSISMLVIDKKKDIGILKSLGATQSAIRNIFFMQGIMQTLVSIFIGFTIASILCFLQMKYGLLSIPGNGTFVVTAYPIKLQLQDYIWVFATIFFIGSVASYFPASLASRQKWLFKQEN